MQKKIKKVLVFGTFDGLHRGHKFFLKQAKLCGNCLIVVLARDNNILNIKGHKPKQAELIRLHNVAQLNYVDRAILGNKYYRNRTKIISKIKPQIICLGYDQPLPRLKDKTIKILRLSAYKPDIYKSSLLSRLAKKRKS